MASYRPQAAEEFRRARRWYRSQASKTISEKFAGEVDATIQRIEAGPEHFQRYPKSSCRWVRLKRFPYLLIYEIVDEDIVIIAIAHEKRSPGYWAKRV